ncbi:DNA primase [Candidatus Roizmanbacteria bacterium]|nr:DNA primase [Candidatus Roizmanbacteria bacterium]
MDNALEEIKRKIDIVEFIGSFVTLKKSGRNFKAICPFHQEKTPSFVVSPERQIWHCFGSCQDGGDVIRFLMKWENITFFEAFRELADRFGIKYRKSTFEDQAWKKRQRLIEINTLAAEYFEYILHKTRLGEKASNYIAAREINIKIVKKFQIGYAPQSWDSLFKFLKKKKYELAEITETGLLVKGERGSYYDRFRGRIMFPIKDARGNIIGFSGRILNPEEKIAKYINTPETSLYHKRESLFGIDLAKEAIKKKGEALLVEGEFDVISPNQLGIENVVAIKGSAVTREQLMLLKRYTGRITLALDADAAGEEAAKKGIEEAESLEVDVNIVSFDFAKDPDEAARKDPSKFKEFIKKPIPLYDFIIQSAKNKYGTADAFSKKRMGEEVCIFIGKIKNPIVQSHYIKKLATELDVSEKSIEELIRKMRYRDKKRQTFSLIKKISSEGLRETLLQKFILSTIFQNENLLEVTNIVFKIVEKDDFFVPSYQKIFQTFLKYSEKKEKMLNPDRFIQLLPVELRPVFDEIYLFASSDFNIGYENLERLSYEMKRYSLKRKLSELLHSDKEDQGGLKDQLKQINQELNRVEKLIVAM